MGRKKNGLYFLQVSDKAVTFPILPSVAAHTVVNNTPAFDVWHHRLGHPSSSRLSLLKNVINDLVIPTANEHCKVCHISKQKRLPFTTSVHIANSPFDLIHCDIWGLYHIPTVDNQKYFLTIVDDNTRCTWVFLMKQKSETSSLIQSFFTLIKNQFSVSIKMIKSNNGSEFQMYSFYAQHGILHQKSCVGIPQQNATVERKHQHLLAVARALRFQANLPLPFWGYCVLTTTHLINRIPTPLLGNKSPFELLFNKLPNYSYLRVFGCLCYAATLPHNRHKFAPRSKQCIMLGYPQGIKGYRLYDLSTKQIFMSRDVIFYEHLFPFHTSQHFHTAPNTASLVLPHPITDMSAPISSVLFDIDNTTNSPLSAHSFTPLPAGSSPAAPSTALPFSHNTHPSSTPDSSLPLASVISPEHVILDPTFITLRKSNRIHKPPSYLQEFHCNNASLPAPSPSSTPTNQGTASTNFPLSNFLSYSKLAPCYQSFVLNASTIREPTSFHEASQDPHWCEAMQAELATLEANNTWSIQPLPSGKVPLQMGF